MRQAIVAAAVLGDELLRLVLSAVQNYLLLLMQVFVKMRWRRLPLHHVVAVDAQVALLLVADLRALDGVLVSLLYDVARLGRQVRIPCDRGYTD